MVRLSSGVFAAGRKGHETPPLARLARLAWTTHDVLRSRRDRPCGGRAKTG